jgi:hypothetical protein
MNFLVRFQQSIGKCLHLLFAHTKHMVSKALSAFVPNPRQLLNWSTKRASGAT